VRMRLASGCFTERRAACAQRCELMHRLRAVRLLCTAASGPPRRLPPQRLPRSQQAGGEPPPPGLAAVRDSGPPAAPRSVPTPRQSERVQDLAVANRKLSDFPVGVVSSQPPPSAAAALAGRATAAAAVGSLRDALVEYKIALPGYSVGQHRIQCPLCRGGAVSARRSLLHSQVYRHSEPSGAHRLTTQDSERSLAVAIEDGGSSAKWLCHRGTCGWSGALRGLGARPACAHIDSPGGTRAQLPATRRPQDAELAELAGAAPSAASTGPAEPPPAPTSSPAAGAAQASADAKADLPEEADILPASSNAAVAAFFAQRGISDAVLARNGVGVTRVWSPSTRKQAESIVFPYRRAGKLVNCKYRSTESKVFWQSKARATPV